MQPFYRSIGSDDDDSAVVAIDNIYFAVPGVIEYAGTVNQAGGSAEGLCPKQRAHQQKTYDERENSVLSSLHSLTPG